MKFLLSAFVLPILATLAGAEELPAERNLDVVAGPHPTSSPSPKPTPQPTPTPSVSPEPTSSPAPTRPQAPACPPRNADNDGYEDDGIEGCYDGSEFDGGRAYSTCTVLKESETCGDFDFNITGIFDPEFERCSDVWPWFTSCALAYSSCTQKLGSGVFKYGNPTVWTPRWRGQETKWEVKIDRDGVIGELLWYCDDEEDALGLVHFAKWVNGQRLFSTPVGSCDTDAPSVSPAPSTSLQPTDTPAPKCDTPGLPPYIPASGHDYIWKKGTNTDGGAKHLFKVEKNCRYRINVEDGDDTEYYTAPEPWLKRAAELYDGTPEDSSGSLTGLRISADDIEVEACGNKFCTVFLASQGVTGGTLSWSFNTEEHAENFQKLFREVSNEAPMVWETSDALNLKCGSGPFCYDDKAKTQCRIDPYSENCGPFDFLVEGLDGYSSRTGDVWEWFLECIQSYDCTLTTGGNFGYGKPNGVYHNPTDNGDPEWEFKVFASGSNFRWTCPDEESAKGMDDFFEEIKKHEYFGMDPFVCTDSPTMAPTTCKDSFLTSPPLNIGIVIDTSYSTFETTFDGTEVGDVNGDGRPNTILDAEIQAVLELLDVILEEPALDNSNVDIGIVHFDTEGHYKGHFPPLNDDNTARNPDLVNALKALKTEPDEASVLKYNIGWTNFDDGLDKAIEYFNDLTLTDETRTNLMVFLSDGMANYRGDGDDEAWCPGMGDDFCKDAPPNNPSTEVPEWEQGALSFCYSRDESCTGSPYEFCARGIAECQGTDPAKSFKSELKELDRLGVIRVAIGVGAQSNVEVGSGLYLIDNNPLRVTIPEFLPIKVETTDDLTAALRELCPENTPNPTNNPTEPPTDLPTTSPTLGPVDVPTVGPTDNPTQGPTSDFCEYNQIDFTTDGEGDDTSEGYVFPKSWEAYGMRITAITVEERDENKVPRSAYFYQTGDAVAGKALIIQKDDVDNFTPTMNPTGGEITITLDLTHDKGFKLDFFDVTLGGTIVFKDIDGEYDGREIMIEAIDGLQSKEFGVNGIYAIIVTLFGPGALAQMNLCRNPEYTPSPAGTMGLAPKTETSEPSAAPTVPTPVILEEPECPADVKLVGIVGETSYDNLPFTIVSQDTSSVTFEVKGTSSTGISYLYVQFPDLDKNEDCFAYQTIDAEFLGQITAKCMESAPISIVNIFISDSSLSVAKDIAEVPECCYPPEEDTFPVVQYTFEIYCVSQCPDDELAARKLPEANEGSKLRGTAVRSATGNDRN